MKANETGRNPFCTDKLSKRYRWRYVCGYSFYCFAAVLLKVSGGRSNRRIHRNCRQHKPRIASLNNVSRIKPA